VLTGETLFGFDGETVFGRFVLETVAGLRCIDGERQSWAVGGHAMTVEVALDRERYIYVLWVREGWPARPIRRSPLCLAEVYAIVVTGAVREFKKPELAHFKVRAVLDAGLWSRPDVALAPLPENAPASAAATWRLVREVLEVRDAQGRGGQPVPLSAPWLAALCGIERSTVEAGKRWLARHGFITHVADAEGSFGHPLKLWDVSRVTHARRDEPALLGTHAGVNGRRGATEAPWA
jgi:hypothetical protein